MPFTGFKTKTQKQETPVFDRQIEERREEQQPAHWTSAAAPVLRDEANATNVRIGGRLATLPVTEGADLSETAPEAHAGLSLSRLRNLPLPGADGENPPAMRSRRASFRVALKRKLHFGRNRPEASGQEQTASAPVETEAEAAVNAEAKTERALERAATARALRSTLQALRKGGVFRLWNSAEFTSVLRNIEKLAATLEQNPLMGDLKQDAARFTAVREQYDRLVFSCNVYIERRQPRTAEGKARYDAIATVRDFASADMARLNTWADVETASLQDAAAPAPTWENVFREARALQLYVPNLRQAETTGGASSEVLVLNGVLEEGRRHFFKREENITCTVDQDRQFEPARRHVLASIADTSENRELRKLITEFVPSRETTRTDTYDDFYYGDVYASKDVYVARLEARLREYHGFSAAKAHDSAPVLARIFFRTEGLVVTADAMRMLSQRNGEDVNVSRRNVATSRIANLLGMGDLVARSRTVRVTDDQGRSMVGNLMDEAVGESQESAIARCAQTGPLQTNGELIRQLSCIQVLDSLCGQMDRNPGNLFYRFDENGVLTGVQAIDNDLSFGLTNDIAFFRGITTGSAFFKGDEGNKVLALPYIDEALYRHIMALTPEITGVVLQDLLTAGEINAFNERLRGAQEILRAAKQADAGAERKRFVSAEEWSADMSDAFMSISTNVRSRFDEAWSHYAYIVRALNTAAQTAPPQ